MPRTYLTPEQRKTMESLYGRMLDPACSFEIKSADSPTRKGVYYVVSLGLTVTWYFVGLDPVTGENVIECLE